MQNAVLLQGFCKLLPDSDCLLAASCCKEQEQELLLQLGTCRSDLHLCSSSGPECGKRE